MKKVLDFIKKHKKAVIIIAVLAVVAVLVIKIVKTVNNAKNLLAGMQSSASTEKIEERDIVNSVTATGTIVAIDNRTYSTSVTGVKVKEINVEVGDTVKPGDILCVLDGEDIEKQLADAKKMYNADAGRAGIDVQASNRGLNEAVTTRDISAARAEEDKNNAYQDFSSAADECQEAKDAYDDASDDADDAESAMKKAEERLNAAKNAATQMLSDEEKSAALAPYNDELSRLDEYISGLSEEEAAKIGSGWKDNLVVDGDNCNISSVSVSMIYNGDDADVINKITTSVSDLNTKWQAFRSALSAGADAKAATVAAAEADYQKTKAAYEAARTAEESKKTIYDSKAKNVESLYDAFNQTVRNADDSKRSNDSAVASRVDSVKNSKLSAGTATLSDERNIERYEEQLESCVISSSIGGVVTKVDIREGDTYAGGAIVTVEDNSAYEVAAQIDEYDISKVKVGQEVIVKTNGTGDLELEGIVKSIAPHATAAVGQGANVASSVVKYEVRITVNTPCDDLKMDMTAKIEIICDKKEAVLAVPSEAIQQDEEGNYFVEILDSGEPIDSSVLMTDPESVSQEDLEKMQNGENSYESHKVYITKGIEGDYYTEIIGEGLEADMRIVIPNNGVFSDIGMYMDETGAMGGF